MTLRLSRALYAFCIKLQGLIVYIIAPQTNQQRVRPGDRHQQKRRC